MRIGSLPVHPIPDREAVPAACAGHFFGLALAAAALQSGESSAACFLRQLATPPLPAGVSKQNRSMSGSHAADTCFTAAWTCLRFDVHFGDSSDWCCFRHERILPSPGCTSLHSFSTSALHAPLWAT